MNTTGPTAHNLPGHGWTLKKLRRWLGKTWNRVASRTTLQALLKTAGLTWKKCKKLLGKRDSEKRQAFLKQLEELYQRVVNRDIVLIYVDESHFHRDLETGYTWGPIGKRIWRVSDCAPLSDRINWYGAYNFSDGECLIWAEGACNKESTAEFLVRIKEWIKASGRQVVVIWDGAPWHRAKMVMETAKEAGIEIVQLPGYSPDLNPIEGLWKWMREGVTQLCCYDSVKSLFDACKRFIEVINQNPLEIIDRLWPRFELDPEAEKLGVSK